MGLAIEQWLGLLCLCAFGIQNSFSFIAEQREMRSECTKNIGHFCINVIPPPAPKKRHPKIVKAKRSFGGKGVGRVPAGGQGRNIPTKTRRGRRPSPAELGAANNRLPSSANTQPVYQGYQPGPAQQPRWVQPPQSVAQWVPPPAAPATPPNNNGWLFGNMNFGGLFGNAPPAAVGTPQINAANNAMAWSFMTRKKRQAPAEPLEPGDHGFVPRIRRNQGQYEFLNLHCLKTDMAFIECQSTGGVCCAPRPA